MGDLMLLQPSSPDLSPSAIFSTKRFGKIAAHLLLKTDRIATRLAHSTPDQ